MSNYFPYDIGYPAQSKRSEKATKADKSRQKRTRILKPIIRGEGGGIYERKTRHRKLIDVMFCLK
jgi:hypothetical protein